MDKNNRILSPVIHIPSIQEGARLLLHFNSLPDQGSAEEAALLAAAINEADAKVKAHAQAQKDLLILGAHQNVP